MFNQFEDLNTKPLSARLAKTAFAQAFALDVDAVEEVWHALRPPYAELFAWGEGKTDRPDPSETAFFRPFMLAHPLEEESVDLADYAAEWKWDGIRVQIVHGGGETRIYSRGGEEISEGRFITDYIEGQDIMAWVSQGPVTDRTQEHLGRSDAGVAMLRKMFKENMKRVANGEDPLGTVREPHEIITLPCERFHDFHAASSSWLSAAWPALISPCAREPAKALLPILNASMTMASNSCCSTARCSLLRTPATKGARSRSNSALACTTLIPPLNVRHSACGIRWP
mgnify:CR=1 FL=1